MKFQVSVSAEALATLSPALLQKLARRAARKVLRMGSTTATVIFPGPQDLRVIVNCLQGTLVIATAFEMLRGSLIAGYRKSA